MRKIILIILITPFICFADTNILELTWLQPPGYESTLYTSTNLSGTWTPLATNPPPISVYSDKPAAFFYVVVAPTNQVRYSFAGTGNPDYISAPAGATFVDTNADAVWFKDSDDSTNGWFQGI